MLVLINLSNDVKSCFKVISTLQKKKVWKRSKVFIQAGQAKVAPPISSILGQFGINLLDFCDKFNSRTRHLSSDLVLLVSIVVYSNKSFSFNIKPVSLNELFFSLRFEEILISRDKRLLLVTLFKIYLLFSYSRSSNDLIDLISFSERSSNDLKRIIGYLNSFSRFKSLK